MEWKYIEPLEKANSVEIFMKDHELALPKEVVSFIVKHNAGRPVVNRFDTDKRKECVFDGLFSYNEKDAENIYGIYKGELKKLLKKAGLFPIGMEPGGDLICVDIKKDGEICMFGMENGEVEFIAESISEMMNKLY